MNEEIISLIQLILKELNEELLKEKEILQNKKDSITSDIDNLKNEKELYTKKSKSSLFLMKIFNQKKYGEFENNMYNCNNELEKLKAEKNKIMDEIVINEKKIVDMEKILEDPSRISSQKLSTFFNSFQEIEEFCKRKNIPLNCKMMLYLGKKGDNVDFMKEAVSEDLQLIAYDTTYSLEVYKVLIDKLNEYIGSKRQNFGISDFTFNELSKLYDLIVTGKYDDHFVKHIMNYLKHICSSDNFDLNKRINLYYLGLTRMLASGELYRLYKKEDFGQELERIYENNDYVIGCHGTSYKPNSEFIDDDMIFKRGLRKPIRGDAKGSIKFTVACDIPFLELLNYDQNRYGEVSGGYAYILAIPKEKMLQESLLWERGEDGFEYINPKYIIGKYKQFSNQATFIKNPNSIEKNMELENADTIKTR